jgi:hypothetical protein
MRCIRLLSFSFCIVLITLSAVGSDKKSGPLQSSNLRFTVVKDDNNKPVRNASVILHSVEKDGKQAKGGFQLKTDNEGKTESEGLPYGPLRIQVLAPGFQTFGQDYDVNKPDMDIEIRLKRPSDQMSIYDKPKDKPQGPPATPPTEPKPQ